jgi:flagellar hook-associated protein 3 FlgL
MRITDSILVGITARSAARNASQLATASSIAASGKRVSAPSDDPAAYGQVVRYSARLATLDARGRTATRAAGDMNLAEGTLDSAGDLLVRAREIAVEAANGLQGASDRANAGVEVVQIRQQLLALANTTGARGYLFGGTRTDVPPFDAAGRFAGNDNPVAIEVADGVTANAAPSSARAFTTAGVGGRDLFADLQGLADALANNDVTGIGNAISHLDDGQRQVIAARTDAGLSAERLQSAADVTSSATVAVTTARANASEGDATQVLSDLVAARTAYERGVEVTRQVLGLPSLATR